MVTGERTCVSQSVVTVLRKKGKVSVLKNPHDPF